MPENDISFIISGALAQAGFMIHGVGICSAPSRQTQVISEVFSLKDYDHT
jgi:hypothetical protein